ncbi:MAG: hypothetical protein DMG07_19225 [Acidobacteria bacterium]|nr:MAG: hypothetical protein DMG07_19225 [Acidobacteriota bacterium]
MKWLWLALAALLVGFLLWSTLAAQQYRCEVCVEFRGRRNCANASATSERAAARAAQATACGKLAKGRIESMNCASTSPISRTCRKIVP